MTMAKIYFEIYGNYLSNLMYSVKSFKKKENEEKNYTSICCVFNCVWI